jgi:D-sedoheptulose 7-phosphate isomerase
MNRVDALLGTATDGAEYADGYLRYLADVFSRVDREAVSAFAEVLLDARERAARIFFFGNGGSASTASHWVNDLTRWRERPFRAISLTENVAVMSAYANDFGYDEVFIRQLQTLMAPDDVVVALSASGNSSNVVLATEYAKAHGAITVGLTGFAGGLLKEIADISVHAPTNDGEYGPAEDVHLVLNHLVTSYLEHRCSKEIA